MGNVVVQWLVRRTWDLKVESSSPGRCIHIVFLRKTLNSHTASLSPPRCINGNQQIAWGQPGKILGGTLRWISIPSIFIIHHVFHSVKHYTMLRKVETIWNKR